MPGIPRFLFILCVVVCTTSAAVTKRALGMGNGKYANLPAVPTSQINAEAVRAQLAALGFQTVVKPDLDQARMVSEIRDFAGTVNADDIVFFYYSGYGTELEGDNYLLPVNYDAGSRLYPVRTLLSLLEGRKAGQRIIVLDAAWECTGLPENQGLAMMQPPDRTLVSFNTAMGFVKPPSGNTPSRFTAALVEALKKPGLSLTEVFNDVQKNGVQPGDSQRPYLNSSAIDNFYFIPRPKEEPTVVVRDRPPGAGDSRLNPKDQLNYIWIPSGTFQMGCVQGDTKCKAEESPAHPVTISKNFWISNSEVTLTAYGLFLKANPSHPAPRKTQTHRGGLVTEGPISEVTWQDAQDYCKWAGDGGRLPTEAEWEYAARGGRSGEIYPWGKATDPKTQANYSGTTNSELKKTFHEITPVRSFPENGWHLFDMAGNVREWVADFYNPDAYKGPGPFVDPLVSAGKVHVVRGGSWNATDFDLRSSFREGAKGPHDNTTGFRCVLPNLEAR